MSSAQQQPSLLRRLRLVILGQHQPMIALLLLASIVCSSAYFVQRHFVNSGLIDIDRSESLHADFKIDINAATWGEIVVLPGVGEKLARAIVEQRETYGPFESLVGLTDVPGIGEKKLDLLAPYILEIEKPSGHLPSEPRE
ncbi:MAG: ComEA family DNA-binding protein [Mariniblastus sp.]